MTDHPTLAEQIKAVDWAVSYVKLDEAWKRVPRLVKRVEALRAACETLKTMEFAREVLN